MSVQIVHSALSSGLADVAHVVDAVIVEPLEVAQAHLKSALDRLAIHSWRQRLGRSRIDDIARRICVGLVIKVFWLLLL